MRTHLRLLAVFATVALLGACGITWDSSGGDASPSVSPTSSSPASSSPAPSSAPVIAVITWGRKSAPYCELERSYSDGSVRMVLAAGKVTSAMPCTTAAQ